MMSLAHFYQIEFTPLYGHNSQSASYLHLIHPCAHIFAKKREKMAHMAHE